MADASESGHGSLACDCDLEEARAEAARGTEGLWGTYSEMERGGGSRRRGGPTFPTTGGPPGGAGA
eukprot:6619628-Pyramimonas_sp.AAC.1